MIKVYVTTFGLLFVVQRRHKIIKAYVTTFGLLSIVQRRHICKALINTRKYPRVRTKNAFQTSKKISPIDFVFPKYIDSVKSTF